VVEKIAKVCLLAGETRYRCIPKAGNWDGWYREAIPLADERFTQHLAEMQAEEAEKR
jgi:hypothetical protein